jgi:hypothetical protein
LRHALGNLRRLDERFDEVRFNQGLILSNLNSNKTSRRLRDYEFKVFSQWGEDGIIQHLTRVLDLGERTFIEFGVETFFESNCRFLLMKDGWRGFVIDGSSANIDVLRSSYFFWKHPLAAHAAFITKDNINELLARSGFARDLGILSVDLDGNDYYILEAIDGFEPRILICEYNAVFGPTRKISVPYKADFYRTTAHHSNLYWGASLGALSHLAAKKRYSLVGTNSAGNNAFFVRNDLVNSAVEVLTVEAAYRASGYRESRDEQGNLTFAADDERLDIIRGMPVFDVEKAAIEPL